MDKDKISLWFQELQDSISRSLSELDNSVRVKRDPWTRPGGGGGVSRIFQNGKIIDNGGVNFSAVSGPLSKQMAERLDLPVSDFFATGISIVLHPVSPMVPVIHMNSRYFEMASGDKWFGGGIDLTPHYISVDDARYFHSELKKLCDRHNPYYYARFKKWADDYFYLPHRRETRGAGGIFFDHLTGTNNKETETIFNFIKELGLLFYPVYSKLVTRNINKNFGRKELEWQQIRRGRYVEFNLIMDRGTRFGLETGGRTESILMSLPRSAGWQYDFTPEKGSEEEKTLQFLKKDIDWINISDD